MTWIDRRRSPAVPAALAAAALLVLMIGVSPDFGFTWDERFQQGYGEQIWEYFHGRIPRQQFEIDADEEHMYGGLADVVCVAAQHVVHADTYVVRHAVIAVFGWLGIVYTGRLAWGLFGARAGWIAAALLTLSPRYFAHAMNNPKDIPFAACAMMALYYLLMIDPDPPHVSWGRAAKIGVSVALAIAVRPLGVMLIGFAIGVFAAFAAVWLGFRREHVRLSTLIAAFGRLTLALVAAIPAGTIAWPWAQGHPFTRPVQAFLISSRANWAFAFPVLYDGRDITAATLPWHYVPMWMLMTIPAVVLAGLALSPLAWRRALVARIGLVALAAFAATPVVSAIVRHATLYDEIRHLLFIIPPIVVLAAAGWDAALGSRLRPVIVALLAIGCAEPLVFEIRNHPNEAAYFSPLVGGPRAAFGRYEMDYWGNSVLQAVKWAAGQAARAGMPVGVAGNLAQAVEADAARYRSLWSTSRYAEDYQLDIRLLRGPRDAVLETAARRDILYRVTTADGAPLCVVVPGPAYSRLQARLQEAGDR